MVPNVGVGNPAEKGHAEGPPEAQASEANLSGIHYSGQGMEQKYHTKAATWLQLAAEQDYPDS